MAMKKCPYCAEEIQEEAILCKHCKSRLDKPVEKEIRTKKCPYCAEIINELEKVCSYCGSEVDEAISNDKSAVTQKPESVPVKQEADSHINTTTATAFKVDKTIEEAQQESPVLKENVTGKVRGDTVYFDEEIVIEGTAYASFKFDGPHSLNGKEVRISVMNEEAAVRFAIEQLFRYHGFSRIRLDGENAEKAEQYNLAYSDYVFWTIALPDMRFFPTMDDILHNNIVSVRVNGNISTVKTHKIINDYTSYTGYIVEDSIKEFINQASKNKETNSIKETIPPSNFEKSGNKTDSKQIENKKPNEEYVEDNLKINHIEDIEVSIPLVNMVDPDSVNSMGRNDFMAVLKDILSLTQCIDENYRKIQETQQRIKVVEGKADDIRNPFPAWLIIPMIISSIIFIAWFNSYSMSSLGHIIVSILGVAAAVLVGCFIFLPIDIMLHSKKRDEAANNYLSRNIPPLKKLIEHERQALEIICDSDEVCWAKEIVGSKLFNTSDIVQLYSIVNSRRADTLKEALNKYDNLEHTQKMEDMQKIVADESIKQTAYAKATSESSKIAADEAVKQTALSRKTLTAARVTAVSSVVSAVNETKQTKILKKTNNETHINKNKRIIKANYEVKSCQLKNVPTVRRKSRKKQFYVGIVGRDSISKPLEAIQL